jgi:hypothetical protein
LTGSAGQAQDPAGHIDPLAAGFMNPPKAARPSIYWLWLNGYVNRDYLEQELAQYRDHGIGGLLIFDMGARDDEAAAPPAGPAFLSDEWMGNLAHAVNIAGRFDLDVQVAACSSWDLGASWVTPEHGSMGLYRTEVQVEGPVDFDAVLPFPELPEQSPKRPDGNPAFFKDVAIIAVEESGGPLSKSLSSANPGQVAHGGRQGLTQRHSRAIDLTDDIRRDGRLLWDVPAGKWTIMRFVCANTGERLKVPSPNSDGMATDHLSHAATRSFIQYVIDRLERKLGNLNESALKQLYLASYEVKGATWTPGFIEQFERLRHYDMKPYLPILAGRVVESEEVTRRFLYDYRKTLGELLVDAYYRTATEVARKAGLGIEAEAGGPGPPTHQVPVDALQALGAIDELRGEFWPWREDRPNLWVVKETASAAHIYGRQRVHMEAFTSFRHWQDGPFDLKPSADRAFCEGMNHVVWHTSSHQPPEAGKPGWVYHAGTHLTPNLAWWAKAKPFLEYLSRCSFLLQQGRFVGDVVYYYGDQGFNFVPPKHVDPSLGYGYDYDVTNADVILNRMSVRDGRITLPDGVQYELMVLPDREDMDLEILKKVANLVHAGATVVGPRPTRAGGLSDYPNLDQQIKERADALWGDCDGKAILEHRYGNGRIVWGRSLREILSEKGLEPDFHFAGDNEGTDLDFIHRRTDEAEIYFVSNRKPQPETVSAYFRTSGKAPEFWYPDSGKIVPQPVFEQTPGGVRVPLKLPPSGSLFVIFRKPVGGTHLISANPTIEALTLSDEGVRFRALENRSYRFTSSQGRKMEAKVESLPAPEVIKGPWKVRFLEGPGTPESADFQTLESWTKHIDPDIRYFSGTARYESRVEIPPAWLRTERSLYLDLGQLWAVGEVFLNGQSLGILWKPPYRIELTVAARPGENILEVEISNTWANRLIGDARSAPAHRYGRTNITGSGTPRKPWKDIALRDSGLLGPVRLIPAVEKTIRLDD